MASSERWIGLILMLAAGLLCGAGSQADERCPRGIHPPSAATDMMAAIGSVNVLGILNSQGALAYAGSVVNPRHLPKVNLMAHRDFLAESIEHSMNAAAAMFVMANGVLYAIFADDVPESRDPMALRAPKQVLWCLLRPGTYLLLHDGHTAHYTMLGALDRENGTVDLADLWPDRIFLLAGNNTKKIAAQLVGRDGRALTGAEATSRAKTGEVLVRITRDELLRVLAGVIIADTPDFPETFYGLYPEAGTDLKTRTAFGLLFLNTGNGRANGAAIPALQAALDLAISQNAAADIQALAGKLALGFWIESATTADESVAAEADRKAKAIFARFGAEAVFDAYEADELLRLGDVFMIPPHADWAYASRVFGTAIRKDPGNGEAYLRRAGAEHRLGHRANAIDDAGIALRLLMANSNALTQARAARHPDDVMGLQRDAWEGATLHEEIVRALWIHGGELLIVKAYKAALADADQLMKLEPGDWYGYSICGQAQRQLGNAAASRSCLERALQLTQDPDQISLLKAQLDDLSAGTAAP